MTHTDDPLSGHVGPPIPSNEVKLVDVAEMGYTSTDLDDKGIPTPRGELCFRGYNCFKGYFAMP